MDVFSLIRSGLVSFVVISMGVGSMAVAQESGKTVRPAYCAGRWYPGARGALVKTVDDLMAQSKAPSLAGKPVAVISPHAGYQYSAPVAAAGYRCLQGHEYKRVIVLAFSHRYAGTYQGVDVPRELTAYETPLGQVPIDREVCDALLKKTGFSSNPGVDGGEHSLELQLPFLQRAIKEFRLVPLLVGRMTDQAWAQAAQAIVPWVDEGTLLVASSDFTHFGPNFGYQPFEDDVAKKLRDLGDKAAAPLLRCDFDGFVEHLEKTGDTICGRGPISLLLRILSMQASATGVLAAFDTSGNMTGDWTNSVTYESIVFTRRPGTLDAQVRAELLRLARRTVTAQLKGKEPPTVEAAKLPAAMRSDGACFVTLQNHGRLRGCIGNMVADGPLYEAVIHNAVSACQDYRFVSNPVTAKELDDIDIEISYLTPMKRVNDPEEIIVGRHGILISLGGQRGVLLPQVAYERGWTRAEFLAQVCRKASLPSNAWKQPKAELHSFEAEVFGEAE
ncbi:MAG: AmmeMemoRadiSam system protein B [Phycisphaerae bacterium]|nr:AmmeMemoRadiSam system protein B [Phycisphaerae bacterium]